MSLVYTQLFSENFHGANQNPINPAKWTTAVGFSALQQINNVCEPSAVDSCAANYTAISWLNNQYAQFTFTISAVNEGEVDIVLRSDSSQDNCYDFGFTNNGDGTLSIVVGIFIGGGFAPFYENDSLSFVSGDIFKAEAFGNTISLYQNSVVVVSVVDSTLSSGFGGLFAGANVSVSDAQVLSFSGGSVAQVPPNAGDPTIDTIYPGAYLGANLLAAFSNPQQLDLIQVVSEGGRVVWSLDAFGTASAFPSFFTPDALIGQFEGSSFAQAFPNPGKFDILQVKNQGGGVVYYVDHTGMPHDAPPKISLGTLLEKPIDGIISIRESIEFKDLSKFLRFR